MIEEEPQSAEAYEAPPSPIYLGYIGPKVPNAASMDDLVVLFKMTGQTLRKHGLPATAHNLWRAFGLKNPRNQAAGSVGGTTAVANMTREQRRARARKGGNQVFHGDTDGTDGVRASARGRLLARRRWAK